MNESSLTSLIDRNDITVVLAYAQLSSRHRWSTMPRGYSMENKMIEVDEIKDP